MVNFKNSFIIIIYFLLIVPLQIQGREVSHINIEDTGLYDDSRKNINEKEACRVFKPTKEQLIRFFNQAKESKKSDQLLHEYYSPCVSIGSVSFKDGTSGHWTIQSSGLALVIFNNGEAATFFNKNNPWIDPYACTYGLSDEIEC